MSIRSKVFVSRKELEAGVAPDLGKMSAPGSDSDSAALRVLNLIKFGDTNAVL